MRLRPRLPMGMLVLVLAMGMQVATGESTKVAKETEMSEFTISSAAFRHNEPIPAKFTCKGADVSPTLSWSGAPPGTKSFALICDDPDAPNGTWVHWVIYNLPPDTKQLPEGVSKSDIVSSLGGAKQGVNDFRKVGYGGPCPPPGHGVHHYHFKLYALDQDLNLKPGATKRQLEEAMRDHVLGQAALIGTFERR
jgi:Raf kinase inhibitor-like YbhB/YbcL family protein